MGAFAEHQMHAGCSAGPGSPVGTPWQEGGGQHKGEAESSAPSITSMPGTSLKRQLLGLQQVPGGGVSRAGPTLRPCYGDCSRSALVAGDRTHARRGRQHPHCRTVPGVWALGLWRGCRPLPCPKEVVPGHDDHLQVGRGRGPSTAAPLGAQLCSRPRGQTGWTVDVPPVETPEGSGPPPLLTASP